MIDIDTIITVTAIGGNNTVAVIAEFDVSNLTPDEYGQLMTMLKTVKPGFDDLLEYTVFDQKSFYIFQNIMMEAVRSLYLTMGTDFSDIMTLPEWTSV